MSGEAVVAVVTERASKRAAHIGQGAVDGVERLRTELETHPRLGRLVGSAGAGGSETYVTRIEPCNGTPGLTVSYLYISAPPPPAVAIALIVPDDSPLDG